MDSLKRENETLKRKLSETSSKKSDAELEQSKKLKAKYDEDVNNLSQMLQTHKREAKDQIDRLKQQIAELEKTKAKLERALLELHVRYQRLLITL